MGVELVQSGFLQGTKTPQVVSVIEMHVLINFNAIFRWKTIYIEMVIFEHLNTWSVLKHGPSYL